MNYDLFFSALQETKNAPFQWGTNDCCLFVANIVLKTTGNDYAAGFRGKYSTKIGAYRLIVKAGGLEVILNKSGYTKADNRFRKIGDICIYQNALGIYDGHSYWFAGGSYRSKSVVDSIYRRQQQSGEQIECRKSSR